MWHKVLDLKKIKLCSVNNKYKNRSYKLTPEYIAFKNLIFYSLKNPPIKLNKPYKVYIYLKTFLDIDNPVKAILDSMAEKKLIINDKKVLRLIIDKVEEKKGYPSDLVIYLDELGDRNVIEIPIQGF